LTVDNRLSKTDLVLNSLVLII